MKYVLFLVVVLIVVGIAVGYQYLPKTSILSPLGKIKNISKKPLEKYTFKNLQKTKFPPSRITLGRTLKEDDKAFISQMFYYTVDDKKISGLINVPKEEGTYPLLVCLRGFVDSSIYTTGEGTRRTAEEFARNGFITLAPDFLGYGESDNPSQDAIEERFQTYTTILTLLSSLNNLQNGLDASYSGKLKADVLHTGIWGHSNGGHIALSVLAITGKSYPTVLWNPVTKPFPYSILYFTDEYEDHGKALRKVVATFENDYDIELYSPTNYYDWIRAPIQLHQALADEAVPLRWSDQFYKTMKAMEKDIAYFTYPGESHNFNNGTWPVAIERSVAFFREYFIK